MIKTKLEKTKKEDASAIVSLSAVSETKLLLDKDVADDVHLVNNLFPSSVNNKVLVANAENVERRKLEDFHKGDVYTTKEIRDICLKYDLRFVVSTSYVGSIPVELIGKLKSTFKTKLPHMSDYNMRDKVFIMAPPSAFIKDNSIRDSKKELKEQRRLARLDPAAFIEIEDGKYLYQHEWGNSFSPFRVILGWLKRKKTLSFLYRLSFFAYIALSVFCIHFLSQFWTSGNNITKHQDNINFFVALGIGLVGLWTIISCISWVWHDGFFMFRFKDAYKNFTLDKDYALENRWNTAK